jgi:hypothetical protein
MLKTFAVISSFAILVLSGSTGVFAQKAPRNMALKSGETLDLGPVYWIAKCSSIVTGDPVAEILDGPPEITATITPAMVLPRSQGCAKEVKGGKLSVTAKDVTQKVESALTIRVKYKTKDGERQATRFYNVVIFPAKAAATP